MAEAQPPVEATPVPPRVYLDTSVISYYAETRQSAQAQLWRSFSRQLLGSERNRFAFWISDLVLAELAQGQWDGRAETLSVADGFQRLPVEERVIAAADFFRENFLAPARPPTDSLHLALASVHHMDVLATWNFRHLANPRKRAHLRVLCARLGLPAPEIVSPLDLLEVEP